MNNNDVSALLKAHGIPVRFHEKINIHLKPLKVKKGDYFCVFGSSANKIGILIHGFLVAKYTNENGIEFISRFYHTSKNGIVSNHFSFVNDVPAIESIQAREDSELLIIHKGDLEKLLREMPELQEYITKFAEKSYLDAMERIHDLQSLSAEQRVRKFIKSNIVLLQIASKSDLASYLGMNRNRFSKLLAKC